MRKFFPLLPIQTNFSLVIDLKVSCVYWEQQHENTKVATISGPDQPEGEVFGGGGTGYFWPNACCVFCFHLIGPHRHLGQSYRPQKIKYNLCVHLVAHTQLTGQEEQFNRERKGNGGANRR